MRAVAVLHGRLQQLKMPTEQRSQSTREALELLCEAAGGVRVTARPSHEHCEALPRLRDVNDDLLLYTSMNTREQGARCT